MFWPLWIISKLALVSTAFSERTEILNILAFIVVTGAGEIFLRKVALYLVARRSERSIAYFATLGNLFYAFCLIIDQRVVSAFGRPLDATLMREGAAAMPVATMLSLFSLRDWAFISLALLTPLALRYRHSMYAIYDKIALPRVWQTAAFAGFISLSVFFYSGGAGGLVPAVIRLPVLALTPMPGQQNTGKPAAATESVVAKPSVRSTVLSETNVLFVILESTGSRYIFDDKLTLPGAGMPMPFLKKLTGQSLYLARHYASSNSSPRAVFSLFTGLYPEASPDFFSLDKVLRIRTVNTYLSPAEQFLVTPTATEWYFPAALLVNNGLTDIIGISKLKFTEKRTHPDDARNEIQTADFFIARLLSAREPFFSVYISFAPHYPYHDYGEDWQITAGSERLDRYVNNLRLLDAQLEKFIGALEKRGILQNTVVVIVGDHSEAFKQHPGNYIHSLYSYEENLAVPALIYAPGRVTPRIINDLTTHADIAPTLLDILNIPYTSDAFQGKSALSAAKRDHIFAYGNEGTITAYGANDVKLQYVPGEFCRTFHLVTDPLERKALGCKGHERLKAAAHQFATTQTDYLLARQQNALKQIEDKEIARGHAVPRRRRSRSS
ncbi:MAG: sulfatase-like hydrolase/transferase [Turneriella sp.]